MAAGDRDVGFLPPDESTGVATTYDAETVVKLLAAQPSPYLVAKRRTWQTGIIVLAYNHVDAKVKAAALSPMLARKLDGNLMAKRLSGTELHRTLNDKSATDLRLANSGAA
jgi:hypothetical protein